MPVPSNQSLTRLSIRKRICETALAQEQVKHFKKMLNELQHENTLLRHLLILRS